MGQYKVPQNVEAEDKIIGPLTLKQFIYTVVGVMIALVSFLTLRKAPVVMILVGVPPAALFLLLGLYQRQGQPFEAVFLSIVSYSAKPRKRLWIKEPIEEVFKIEAPKVVKAVTQRDPHEVRGQLEQLSQVVDTRGWGNKKAELQEPNDEASLLDEGRLVMPEPAPANETIETDVSMADDILDFQNNPNARGIGHLIQDQTKAIRERAIATLHHKPVGTSNQPALRSTTENGELVMSNQPAGKPVDPDIVNVGSGELTTDSVPLPGSTYQPTAQVQSSTSPVAAGTASTGPSTPQSQSAGQASSRDTTNSGSTSDTVTANPLDGILKLAMDNDDLPVSQVAAQANRQSSLAEGQSVSLRNNGNS